jgi:hypothetical protein
MTILPTEPLEPMYIGILCGQSALVFITQTLPTRYPHLCKKMLYKRFELWSTAFVG